MGATVRRHPKWRSSILVATLIATPLVVMPAIAAQAATCSSLAVIGARGSGEAFGDGNEGLGVPNYAVFRQIRSSIPDARALGVPYPAVAVVPDTVRVLSGPYWDSLSVGTPILRNMISQQIASCPYQRLVLLGYSQGAHLVGDGLPQFYVDQSIRDHIAAVVLFGDPRFNPDSPIVQGSFNPSLVGVFASQGITSARIVSSGWWGKTRSYCALYDFICNFSMTGYKKCPETSTCGHFGYVSSGTTTAAGAWIANLVKALPSLAPPPQAAPPPASGQQYSSYRVYHTGGAGLRVRSTPSTAGAVVGSMPEGGEVRIVCQVHGQRVVAETDIWDRLTSGGYVYDEYVNTPNIGTFSVRQC